MCILQKVQLLESEKDSDLDSALYHLSQNKLFTSLSHSFLICTMENMMLVSHDCYKK